ncbi:MAG: AAA family ATPase [Clostridia bacterium]|nr:AAA family ATPase [Clostridia bacterium]
MWRPGYDIGCRRYIRDTVKRIEEIEAELSLLPHWSIIKRNVNGKDYYYTRIKEDGRAKDIYLGPDVDEQELALVARRKELEKELKRLKIEQIKSKSMNPGEAFRTDVLYGGKLRAVVDECAGLKRRDCFDNIRQYIHGTSRGKVFILYGLRRTGKTTLMCQVIADMDEADYDKTALIRVTSGDTLKDVDRDMRSLQLTGFKYVFIDEVTFLDEFIRCAEIFSDIFAASGMKVVLTGTDSLGFKIASEERLFDRCFMLHTTFIPYKEFEEVLGVSGIDEYISRGGTMSVSGENYNGGYGNKLEDESAEIYVNTSIAVNIQNSLKNYEYGGRFRNLKDLYKSGELTSAINRIVENINHEFAVEVLMSDFDSRDFD